MKNQLSAVVKFGRTFTSGSVSFAKVFYVKHHTKISVFLITLLVINSEAFAQGGGMVTGANNLVNAIVAIVNILFIGFIVFGVINVVKKYVTDEPDAGGSFVRLAMAIMVFTAFSVYKNDIISYFSGSATITGI